MGLLGKEPSGISPSSVKTLLSVFSGGNDLISLFKTEAGIKYKLRTSVY